MKYLKKKVLVSELDVKRAEKESLAATLQKLVNSKDDEEYSKAYNDLQSHDAEFVRYFDKNWHSCQDLWVIHKRANLRTHGNNTNNKVESHNQKLKNFLNKQMRIPEAKENLSLFIDEWYTKSSYNKYYNLKTEIDQRNTDAEILKYSMLCNSKSFTVINEVLFFIFFFFFFFF